MINPGASLSTQNTLGFRTGTGNTTLTGSIAIRPGNRGAPVYSTAADYTFNGTAAQQTGNAITGAATLTISNAAGVTAANTLSVTNLVTEAGATLHMGTNALTVTNTNHLGILTTQNTSATPISAGKTWGGTVSFISTGSQTIVPGSYHDLTASGGNRMLSTVDTIHISGIFAPGTGTYIVLNSIVDFDNNGDQDIPDFTFHHLVLTGSGIKKITGGTLVTCRNLVVDEEANLAINGSGGATLRVQLP
jgi:hypothetical protein